MVHRPTATLRVARATARRAMLADFVRLAGWSLLFAAALGLMLVGGDRLAGGLVDWRWLILSAIALGVVTAATLSAIRRWDALRAAEAADEALGLKDTLSSAIALSSPKAQGVDDSFAAWTISEAEAAAGRVQARDVVKIRWEWVWGAWPVLAAGAVAVALLVPPVRWGSRQPRIITAEQIAERQTAAASVQQVVQTLADEPVVRDIAAERELKALEELHQELTSGRAERADAQARAASELESLASKLEGRAEQDRLSRDLLKDRMAMAAAQRGRQDRAGSGLQDAFEGRDLERAAELLEEYSRRAEEMSPQEREGLARDLEDLARAMEQLERAPAGDDGEQPVPGSNDPPEGSPPGEAAQTPESAERDDATPPTREQIERELRDSGMDPAQARREAERIHEEELQERAQQQAREQSEQLKQAMEETARELREPQPPAAGPPQSTQERPDQNQGEQAPPQQQGQERPAEGQQQGSPDPGDKQPQPQPDQQQKGEPRPEQQPEPGQEPQPDPASEQPSPEPGSQQEQRQRASGRQGNQEQQQQTQPGPETPGQQKAPQPQQGERRQSQPTTPEQQPGAPESSESPPQMQPKQQDQPGKEGGSAIERLQRQLNEVQQQGERAREQAQRTRELTEKLLENASPEEIRRAMQPREDGQQLGGRQSGGPDTPRADRSPPASPQRDEARQDAVDARRPGEERARERIVAEWFSDRPVNRDGSAAPLSPAQSVQEAARSAERAVEQQAVPARYSDLVRRVFRRYSESAPR